MTNWKSKTRSKVNLNDFQFPETVEKRMSMYFIDYPFFSNVQFVQHKNQQQLFLSVALKFVLIGLGQLMNQKIHLFVRIVLDSKRYINKFQLGVVKGKKTNDNLWIYSHHYPTSILLYLADLICIMTRCRGSSY